jgi:hypothetical protein
MLIRSSALEVRIVPSREDAGASVAALLRDARPCLGDVRPVFLDDVARMQQVHDGQFPSLDDVPKQASRSPSRSSFGFPARSSS